MAGQGFGREPWPFRRPLGPCLDRPGAGRFAAGEGGSRALAAGARVCIRLHPSAKPFKPAQTLVGWGADGYPPPYEMRSKQE